MCMCVSAERASVEYGLGFEDSCAGGVLAYCAMLLRMNQNE